MCKKLIREERGQVPGKLLLGQVHEDGAGRSWGWGPRGAATPSSTKNYHTTIPANEGMDEMPGCRLKHGTVPQVDREHA